MEDFPRNSMWNTSWNNLVVFQVVAYLFYPSAEPPQFIWRQKRRNHKDTTNHVWYKFALAFEQRVVHCHFCVFIWRRT